MTDISSYHLTPVTTAILVAQCRHSYPHYTAQVAEEYRSKFCSSSSVLKGEEQLYRFPSEILKMASPMVHLKGF